MWESPLTPSPVKKVVYLSHFFSTLMASLLLNYSLCSGELRGGEKSVLKTGADSSGSDSPSVFSPSSLSSSSQLLSGRVWLMWCPGFLTLKLFQFCCLSQNYECTEGQNEGWEIINKVLPLLIDSPQSRLANSRHLQRRKALESTNRLGC